MKLYWQLPTNEDDPPAGGMRVRPMDRGKLCGRLKTNYFHMNARNLPLIKIKFDNYFK